MDKENEMMPIWAQQGPKWGRFPSRNNQRAFASATLNMTDTPTHQMERRYPPTGLMFPIGSESIHYLTTWRPKTTVGQEELIAWNM